MPRVPQYAGTPVQIKLKPESVAWLSEQVEAQRTRGGQYQTRSALLRHLLGLGRQAFEKGER